jgi:hypothetical protein
MEEGFQMKIRLPRFIGLTALVAMLCFAPPAAAYWPPCQNVTGPTVVGNQVTFSVVNPATGQTVPGSWDIPSGYSVDQLASNQGIVAWRAYDGYLHYTIHYATYDPVRGWAQGTSYNFTSTSILSIQDGVVCFEVGGYSYPIEWWVTYDPRRGWRNFYYSFSTSSGAINDYFSKNGVVAVHYNFSASGGDALFYQVYDPTRFDWKSESVGGAAGDVIQYVSIDDYGAIHYTLNGTGYKKGYSVTNGVWQDGAGGSPAELYAAFVAQTVSGKAPFTVWVTDMSLGAAAGGLGVTFAYDWGDGASSPNLRSGFHTYTLANKYTLGHTVTRGKTVTYESDTRTTQIKNMTPLPFAQLLLLDN